MNSAPNSTPVHRLGDNKHFVGDSPSECPLIHVHHDADPATVAKVCQARAELLAGHSFALLEAIRGDVIGVEHLAAIQHDLLTELVALQAALVACLDSDKEGGRYE